MGKQLKFNYDGKDYVLEFTRRTVAEMERKGFIAADAETKPMSTLPAFFAGAFLAHHRYEKQETIDKIFAAMTHKDDLFNKLAEMYSEPITTLIEEPEESAGNVNWTATF